jgi:DNA-binding MarR family transcriptional regulator
MTERLDRMAGRGLITRELDPGNRTEVLVPLADAGWQQDAAASGRRAWWRPVRWKGSRLLGWAELGDLREQMIANLDSSRLPEGSEA